MKNCFKKSANVIVFSAFLQDDITECEWGEAQPILENLRLQNWQTCDKDVWLKRRMHGQPWPDQFVFKRNGLN